MIREDTFYYLSLLAYYNVKKIGVSVAKLCQMIEKDKDVLQQAEEMDDAKGNLEMIKRMPFENYRNLYLVSCFDDNKNSGVVYDVYENEEAIFIAFRGSEILDERNHTTGWQDWMDNFEMFLDGPTWQQILSLHQLQKESLHKPFYLCGHSKGGNLALYCALCMKEKNLTNLAGVYTFNAPGITKSVLRIYKDRAKDPVFLDKLHIFENEHDCVSSFFEHLKEPILLKSSLPCRNIEELYRSHQLYTLHFVNNGYVIAEKKSAVPVLMYHFINDFFVNQKKEKLEIMVRRMEDYFQSDLSMAELYKVFFYHVSQYTSLFEGIPYENMKSITFQDLMEHRKSKIMLRNMNTAFMNQKELLNEIDVKEITQGLLHNYELLYKEATGNFQEKLNENNKKIIQAIRSILKRKDEDRYFMIGKQLGFSTWKIEDLDKAHALWNDIDWIRAISDKKEIAEYLNEEIEVYEKNQVQYFPLYLWEKNLFIGCCGMHVDTCGNYLLGIYMKKEYRGKGYGKEALEAILMYAVSVLSIQKIYACNPQKDEVYKDILIDLGFVFSGERKDNQSYVYEIKE